MSAEAAELAEYVDGASSRITALYRAHAQRAGRLAYLLTGDVDVAEDLTQEAFARLIGRLDRIRNENAIDAYLRRSVVNLARKHWKKRGRERAYLQGESARLVDASGTPPDMAARDELWAALRALPYRQRAAIVLRFYEDLTERDTARALGCAIGTVKSSVARGLRQMREELSDDKAV
jgi:RNA polymerase sigma-70 factor (sigma-E family)